MQRSAAAGRPFFLWTTYVAPHLGGPRDLFAPQGFGTTVPSPLFANAFIGTQMPRTPAFDEADVSDKPAGIRNRRRLGPREQALLDAVWRKRQQSLLSVDLGVRRIVRALERAGVLDDTLLVFTSDNGYLIGEHRVRESKVLPYEPSIRVPLLMRGPGIPRGATRSQLVWNGDLAPTILAATGADAAWPTDGMSLLPFARDPLGAQRRATSCSRARRSPAPAASRCSPGCARRATSTPSTAAARSSSTTCGGTPTSCATSPAPPAVAPLQRELAARLARLRDCEGVACRAG